MGTRERKLGSGHEVFLSFVGQGKWGDATCGGWFKHWAKVAKTVAKDFLGFICCPEKWFSYPQSKGIVMDGQLPWAEWCPQPASGTTLFFLFPQMFPKSATEQINYLRVTSVWFLAPTLLPCKDPSNFLSEQHPLKYPPSATCVKNPNLQNFPVDSITSDSAAEREGGSFFDSSPLLQVACLYGAEHLHH